MNRPPAGTRGAQELFGRLLGELRPKLHRYCARTTGSVLSGEGVLQHRGFRCLAAGSPSFLTSAMCRKKKTPRGPLPL